MTDRFSVAEFVAAFPDLNFLRKWDKETSTEIFADERTEWAWRGWCAAEQITLDELAEGKWITWA